MADKLKYSTTQPTLPGLRTDDFVLGTGDGNYGPTSTTSYLNGFTAPEGGYVVYTLGLNNTPIGWVASNDTELIDISRHLGNTTLDIKAAKIYLAGLTDTWVFNSTPNNIVTDGLECYVDGLNLTSYPETGTSWYDISGRVRIHTIQNTPSFDPSLGLLFDGVDDSVNIDPNSYRATQTPGTMEVVFKPLDAGSPQVIAATTENRDRIISIVDGGHIRGCQYNGVLGVFCGGQYLPTIFEKYHHVAFAYTVDNGNGNSEYTLWVDGEEVANQLLDITTTVGNDTNVNTLGGTSFNFIDGGSRSAFGGVESSTGFFNGRISKFLTHNRFLSETEVKQNYYGGPIVTDGLVFAVDASNLVSYENGSVYAYSLTGSNIGVLSNGTGYLQDNGGVWEFDGVDDQLIGTPAGVTWFTNTSFSVEAWVKPDINPPQYQVYFDGVGPTGGTNKNLHLRIYDYGALRMGFFSDDLNSPSGIVNFGEWNHIIMQYDFSTDTSEIYHNGVKVASGNQGPFNDTSATFHIGYWASSSTQYFKGNIGCTRVYSKVLSAGEIQQNFEAHRSRFGV